jgi:DNA-binding MarR family transcriptional regulator
VSTEPAVSAAAGGPKLALADDALDGALDGDGAIGGDGALGANGALGGDGALDGDGALGGDGALDGDSGVGGDSAAGGARGPEIDVTRLRVALARLARRLRRHELAGLTPTQLAALATVGRSGPMRLGDLAAAEGIAPSTLTRLVTALEDSGYVRRFPDPTDARASTLAITSQGHDVLERVRTESTLVLAASLQLLTPAQRSSLADALPVLEQLAEAELGESRSR